MARGPARRLHHRTPLAGPAGGTEPGLPPRRTRPDRVGVHRPWRHPGGCRAAVPGGMAGHRHPAGGFGARRASVDRGHQQPASCDRRAGPDQPAPRPRLGRGHLRHRRNHRSEHRGRCLGMGRRHCGRTHSCCGHTGCGRRRAAAALRPSRRGVSRHSRPVPDAPDHGFLRPAPKNAVPDRDGGVLSRGAAHRSRRLRRHVPGPAGRRRCHDGRLRAGRTGWLGGRDAPAAAR